MTVSTQNARGEWVPAIPEPYYLPFGRRRCSCGETRWGTRSYREHYALAHIIEGRPTTTVTEQLDEASRGLRTVLDNPGLDRFSQGPSLSYQAPEGPAFSKAPPNPGVASKAGADRPAPGARRPEPRLPDPGRGAAPLHWDAGGEDSVACGLAGFSTRDRDAVTCRSCQSVMTVIDVSPTAPERAVYPYPRRAEVPPGWTRSGLFVVRLDPGEVATDD